MNRTAILQIKQWLKMGPVEKGKKCPFRTPVTDPETGEDLTLFDWYYLGGKICIEVVGETYGGGCTRCRQCPCSIIGTVGVEKLARKYIEEIENER